MIGDRPTEGDTTPVTADEAVAWFDAVLMSRAGPVAVAVSGGPDSTALLYLADIWARSRGRTLLVLTVDHGLRPASAREAGAVADLAGRMGHPHRTLVWRGEKPRTGLQAAARTARLSLLLAACHTAGASALLLGHHRDDQAETVLHRVDRDTGPEGLAGMAARSWRDGVLLARPFLEVGKGRLVATCRAAGLAFAEDPSNADPRFARARLRALRGALDDVGLTADRLARLSTAMGRARAAMDRTVEEWLDRHAVRHPCASVSLELEAIRDAPPVLRVAVLRAVLRQAGGGGYPPGTEAMAALTDWISGGTGRGRTLAGCRIGIDRTMLHVVREADGCAPPRTVAPGGRLAWDGRFLICNGRRQPVRVQACGEAGWRRLRLTGRAEAAIAGSAGLPHAARLAWPLVTDLDGVTTLPHLVTNERGAPDLCGYRVQVCVLATRECSDDGPLANKRRTK